MTENQNNKGEKQDDSIETPAIPVPGNFPTRRISMPPEIERWSPNQQLRSLPGNLNGSGGNTFRRMK